MSPQARLVIARLPRKSINYEEWRIASQFMPNGLDRLVDNLCYEIGCNPQCMSSLECWRLMRNVNEKGYDIIILRYGDFADDQPAQTGT